MEHSTATDRTHVAKPPPGLMPIDGWRDWKPFLATPEEPEALVQESLLALAWLRPVRASVIRHSQAPSLVQLPWTALEVHIRAEFTSRITFLGDHDGYLMRAQIAQLYPGALALGDWDRFVNAPALITVKAALQENVRLLLFYATVFATYGMDEDLAILKPALDLSLRGVLPLGINAERHLYLVAG